MSYDIALLAAERRVAKHVGEDLFRGEDRIEIQLGLLHTIAPARDRITEALRAIMNHVAAVVSVS